MSDELQNLLATQAKEGLCSIKLSIRVKPGITAEAVLGEVLKAERVLAEIKRKHQTAAIS